MKSKLADGTKYKVADKYKFYRNDVEVEIGDDVAVEDEFDYAKIYFDKSGKVEHVVAYNWDDFFVVKEMDGDVAVSYDKDELKLKDYLIFKDGKSIKATDLKAGDVIFFNENANDEDGVAEVFNSTVTGKIDTVFANDLRIDGKTYSYTEVNYGKRTQFLDKDKFKDLSDKDAEKLQAGGDVTVYLDRDGNAVYITGAKGNVNSNTVGFHATEKAVYYILQYGLKYRGTVELEGLNSKGEEKLYSFLSILYEVIRSEGVDYEADRNFPNLNNTAKASFTETEIEKFALLANR